MFPYIQTFHCFLILSSFFTTSALLNRPHAHRRDYDPFVFQSSCNQVQKELVTQAWHDAMSMAFTAGFGVNDSRIPDISMDLFGPLVVNEIGVAQLQSVFRKIAAFDLSAVTVTCDVEDATNDCKDKFNYGGIKSTSNVTGRGGVDLKRRNNPTNVKMTFCWEFFTLAPLDRRIIEVTNNAMRFDLGTFHLNQGTSMLRELLHHLPKFDFLPDRISDLWVLFPTDAYSKSISWLGCYGPACARFLAIVNGTSKWSALNANNYALYALMLHLQTPVYPWLPLPGPNLYGAFLEVASVPPPDLPLHFWYINTDNFNIANLRYFSYIYPYTGANIGMVNKNQVANISGSFIFEDSSAYPQSFWEQRRSTFGDIYDNIVSHGLINWGLDPDIKCVSKHETPYPPTGNTVRFNRETALEKVDDWCRYVISGQDASSLVRLSPFISNGRGVYPKDHKAYGAKSSLFDPVRHQLDSTGDAWLNLGLGLENDNSTSTYIVSYLGQVFEGTTTDELISHCNGTFQSIIDSCDVGSTDQKYGGVMRIRGFVFTIFAANSNFNWFDDYGNDIIQQGFECGDIDVDTYYVALQNNLDPEKVCVCWYKYYPHVKDIFCKPVDGSSCGSSYSGRMPVYNATEARVLDDSPSCWY